MNICKEEMAVSVEWKAHCWFVYWEISKQDKELSLRFRDYVQGRTLFPCADHNYILTISENADYLSLALNFNEKGNKINRPSRVVAFHKGVMKKLEEVSAGQWGPVRWYIGQTDRLAFQYKYPNFQLILEFDPPKAEGEGEVSTPLSELPANQSVADVVFLVDDQVFDAHSAIVASSSPAVAQMLKDTSKKENPVQLIVIKDVEPNAFRQVLRYMYTGVEPDFQEMAEPLLKAAHTFQMKSLKEECEHVLISQLTVENAVDSLLLAREQSAGKLLESSLQCIAQHKDSVCEGFHWKRLVKQNPDLLNLTCQ